MPPKSKEEVNKADMWRAFSNKGQPQDKQGCMQFGVLNDVIIKTVKHSGESI